jgi:putative ABC transport system permease protein
MEDLLRDFRMGWRSLVRRKTSSLAALACAALGIGLCTTVWSACYAILLRPFPFADADGLLAVVAANPPRGIENGDLAYLDYRDLAQESRAFATVAGHVRLDLTFAGMGEPERVSGAAVSASLFPLLGVAPALGRQFLPEEDQPGAPGAVMLGHAFWRRSFGADPAVVGTVIQVENLPHRVIGVMPAGFEFPGREQAWIPLAPRFANRERKIHEVSVLARLAPGQLPRQAQAEVETLGRRLADEYPEVGKGWQWRAVTLRQLHVSPGMRTMSWTLFGAAVFVLLIACANVANLLLARAESRGREISVRVALGATPWQILRQFLAESLLLAAGGGFLGLLLAAAGVKALILLFPAANPVPYWMEFSLDLPVLFFTALITLATCVLSGLAPAAKTARFDLLGLLNAAGRGVSGGRGRLRAALVVAEVALSVTLLIGGALFARSFDAVKDAPSGFAEEALATFRLHLSGAPWNDESARIAQLKEILRRVEGLPGVEAAYVSTLIPFAGGGSSGGFEISGRENAGDEKPRVFWAGVSPDFFRVLQVPIEAGRAFTGAESWEKAPLAVVNRRFADRYFPNAEAVGQQLRIDGTGGEPPWLTIVGVARDFKTRQLDMPAIPTVYLPYAFQAARNNGVVLRTRADPGATLAAARAEIRALHPGIPVFDAASMSAVREASIWQFQLVSRLFSTFGALALVLALTGLYGVLSYMVTERWREIGIRVALGAQNREVVLLVMRQGMWLAGLGLAFGLVGAFLLTRLLASFLYGVSATDPLTFGVLALFLLTVAGLANYLPARRATRVDPVEVLREN